MLTALLVAVFAAGWTVWVQSVKDPTVNYVDLLVYRDSVAAWEAGHPVYGSAFTSSLLPFTYPPFALVALSWLPALGVRAAGVVQLAGSVLAVAVISMVTVRAALPIAREAARGRQAMLLRSPAAGPVAALVFFAGGLGLEPVTHTLDFGQVNLALCALVVLDCLVVPPRWRGVLSGLAAAVKLTPGIFLLYFLGTRQGRAAARQVLSAVAATLLTMAVAPRDSFTYWTSTLFVNRTGPAISASNQNWTAIADRLLPTEHLIAAVAILVADVATLAVGAVAVRRAHADGYRVTALVTVGLVGLMVSPVSWSHHWVWALPLLVALVLERPIRGARAMAVLAAAVFAAGAQWHVPHFFGRELTWTWWQVLLGNSYLFCGVGVLILAAGAPARAVVRHPVGPLDRT